LPGPRGVLGVTFDIHSLYYSSLAVITGFQAVAFWSFAKLYIIHEGLAEPSPLFRRFMGIATLESGLCCGSALILAGVLLGVFALQHWSVTNYGTLAPSEVMRIVIPSGVAVLLGTQVMFSGFFASVLEIRRTRPLLQSSGPEILQRV